MCLHVEMNRQPRAEWLQLVLEIMRKENNGRERRSVVASNTKTAGVASSVIFYRR